MADKAISELTAATLIGPTDLFVMEQGGTAKKATGQLFENWLLSLADGHGGIQSLVKTSSTGTDPVIDTYTITYADTTTSTFTVTNGLKGDKGDQTYVWIKYAAQYPTADSDMSSSPDDWIGVYSGTSSTAPTHYTDYTWFEWKGATGDPGDPSEVTSYSVTYLEGTSGTVVPEGSWTTTIPTITPGNFLWTRLQLAFNDDTITTVYSVARFGIDGTGSVSSVNNQSPDGNGNVTVAAADIQTTDSTSVQSDLTGLKNTLTQLGDDVDAIETATETLENGLAIPKTGDTADTALSVGTFINLSGNSTLDDGLYQVSSAISQGATYTTSNLTKQATNNGALNTIFPSLSYSQQGLTTDKCTIVNGGYAKFGNIVIVNIRITLNGAGAHVAGLPVPLTASGSYIGGGAYEATTDNPAYFYVALDGTLSIPAHFGSSGSIIVSVVYLSA